MNIALILNVTTQVGTQAAHVATQTVAEIAREFFTDVFLNPGKHIYAIAYMGALAGAPFVGAAFLAKYVWGKYHPI